MMIRKINGHHINISGEKNSNVIVFIHGFPFDHSMWEYQAKFLNKDYKCITFDLTGFGKSNIGDGQITIDTYAGHLNSILDKLKIKSATLFGLSMGGYIALRFYQKYPNKVKSFILADTKSFADENGAKLKRLDAINSINKNYKKYIRNSIPPLLSEKTLSTNKKLLKGLVDKALKFNPKALIAGQIAMMGRTDTTEVLSSIEVPVLLIVGKEDKLTPPAIMKKMSRKIKNSTFAEIKEAGHLAPMEQPDEVNAIVKTFLESL